MAGKYKSEVAKVKARKAYHRKVSQGTAPVKTPKENPVLQEALRVQKIARRIGKAKAPKFEPQVYSQSVSFDVAKAIEEATDRQKRLIEKEVMHTGIDSEKIRSLEKESTANQDRYEDAENALIREMKHHELRAQELRYYLEHHGYGFDCFDHQGS